MLHHLNIICILMIEGTNVMPHGSQYKKCLFVSGVIWTPLPLEEHAVI